MNNHDKALYTYAAIQKRKAKENKLKNRILKYILKRGWEN